MSSPIFTHQRYARRCARPLLLGGMALLLVFSATPEELWAQRPVPVFQPFYRTETARRTFFDRYALTAEVSYLPTSERAGTSVQNRQPATDPLGLFLHFDYQLAAQFDLGVLVSAAGNSIGRSLGISWITLKYYRSVESSDYAFRLAVDPSSDGRSGFPQMDFAFLNTTLLTPVLTSDFAVGVRSVRLGYQNIEFILPPDPAPGDPLVGSQEAIPVANRSRAVGWELHMMMRYNLLFDPAGSNLFVTFLGEGGRYNLVEWNAQPIPTVPLIDAGQAGAQERTTTAYRGGVVRVRTGMEWERPSYKIAPFLSYRLLAWQTEEGDWPTPARMRVGMRLMIR